MPNYEQYIRQFLQLFERLVESQERLRFPQWAIALLSAVVGGFLGFAFGWWADQLKERRDRNSLREALYQEIANNYEAMSYWIEPERGDLYWLKQNIYRQVTFFAYETAGRNPGWLYRFPEHGWFIATFRELRELCEQCQNVDDKELIKLLSKALGTIESGDSQFPEAKVKLRSKLQEKYRAKVK